MTTAGPASMCFITLPDRAIDREAAQGRTLQPGNAAQQRGLARAGVAEQSGDAARGQVQVHIEPKA